MRSTADTVCRLVALMPLFLLAACTSWLPEAHKLEITQGNAVKPEQLESLQPGMTRSEITSIIGSPTLQDPFHPERWDYIYRHIPSEGEQLTSRLTLFFQGDTLVRIDDSGYVEPAVNDERVQPANSGRDIEIDRSRPDID